MNGHGSDLKATAAKVLQVQSMVKTLLEPNIGNDVPLWQKLASLRGFLEVKLNVCRDWLVRRCSANELPWCSNTLRLRQLPVPPSTSRLFEILYDSIGAFLPCGIVVCHCEASAPPVLVFCNQFCFNDARKARKEAIRIQHERCIHEPSNLEFKLALSWMQRHIASFRRHWQDAAYNVVLSRSVGKMVQIPADVTKFDIARGSLLYGIQVSSVTIAFSS